MGSWGEREKRGLGGAPPLMGDAGRNRDYDLAHWGALSWWK